VRSGAREAFELRGCPVERQEPDGLDLVLLGDPVQRGRTGDQGQRLVTAGKTMNALP
jgi:hypothetical protein